MKERTKFKLLILCGNHFCYKYFFPDLIRYLLDRAHFWIGEQQPRFYQTLYSPVPLFRILDVNSFPILSPGHFKIMGKKKKCCNWCHVCTSDYILHKKVYNVFLLPLFKADEQKWLYILAQF